MFGFTRGTVEDAERIEAETAARATAMATRMANEERAARATADCVTAVHASKRERSAAEAMATRLADQQRAARIAADCDTAVDASKRERSAAEAMGTRMAARVSRGGLDDRGPLSEPLIADGNSEGGYPSRDVSGVSERKEELDDNPSPPVGEAPAPPPVGQVGGCARTIRASTRKR
jgi:hypothetical protein